MFLITLSYVTSHPPRCGLFVVLLYPSLASVNAWTYDLYFGVEHTELALYALLSQGKSQANR